MKRYDVHNLRPNWVGLTCGARLAPGGAIRLPEKALQEGDWNLARRDNPFIRIVEAKEGAKPSATPKKSEPEKPQEKKPSSEEQIAEAKAKAEKARKEADEKARRAAEEQAAKAAEAEAAQQAQEEAKEEKPEQETEETFIPQDPAEPEISEPEPEAKPDIDIPDGFMEKEWKTPRMLDWCGEQGIKIKGAKVKANIIRQVKEFYGLDE